VRRISMNERFLPIEMTGDKQVNDRGRKRVAVHNGAIVSVMLLASTGIVSGAAAPAAFAQAPAPAQQRNFSITAQSLADALMQFGQQSGFNVSAPANLTRNLTTRGVSGAMAPAEALSRLLAGTGLTFRFTGPTSVQLEPAPQAAQDAIQLGPVRVEGSGTSASGMGIAPSVTSDIAATEKTGSYTTRLMSTSTRLELTPRETPQSVTVITRQRMDDAGMVDLLDAVRSTPGLTVTPYGVGRPGLYARGFGIDVVTQDRITSVFNSYIPSPLGNLAVYDRIEVVRGSTGLMQGAGNPAAAINLFRKRPTSAFQAELTGAAGSWNDFSGQIDISGPIAADGAISGRVVGYIQDADNFRDFERQKRRIAYATLDLKPTETTRLNIGYSYLDSYTNMVWGGLPVTDEGEHYGLPRSTFIGADWEYLKQGYHTVYASLDQELGGDWRFTANAMYVNGSTDLLATWIMPDEVNGGYGHVYWAGKNKVDQKGVDAFVTGSVNLFGRAHELVGTLNREKGRQEEFFNDWSVLIDHVPDLFAWDPRTAPKPSLDPGSPDYYDGRDSRSQDSLYATARLNPADPLKLIVGARLDWYRSSGWSDFKQNGQLTLYGGVIYDISRNYSLYASYTDIFQPQNQRDVNRQVLKPITGRNYEIGLKGEYLDGVLNLSVALFQIEQANRARQLDDQSGCPMAPVEFCYEASGMVRSRGVDAELQGELAPGWQVGAGYTYSHAEYRKDADPALIGTRFDTAQPEHQFKASTSYTLPGKLDHWRVGADLTWQSEIYRNLTRADGSLHRNRQSAYALLGLMVEYRPTERFSIQANLKNVFDETYYLSIADDIYWGGMELYGEPRNIMVTARYRF
jgi:outer membrane receptor for ferric coprogen and ferric-rhodotorulic acid